MCRIRSHEQCPESQIVKQRPVGQVIASKAWSYQHEETLARHNCSPRRGTPNLEHAKTRKYQILLEEPYLSKDCNVMWK